jgi:hypothetical protein
MDKDAEHLRLLGILSYVYGGLQIMGSFFPLIYVLFGGAMVAGAFGPPPSPGSRGGAPPPEFGWFFVVLGLIATTIILLWAVSNLLAGRWLRACKNRTLCIVVAAFNCINLPLGTLLGVFSLVVLLRESVAQRFRDGLPAA